MTVKTLGCGCSRSINEEGEVVAVDLCEKHAEKGLDLEQRAAKFAEVEKEG
jgi:hypothetical protein|tara:strand:+ start:811 stop:963 length:153 start_codon:yes stop_codon:yes gene_type:complete